MAAIDHDVGLDLGLGQVLFAQGDADRVVVGFAITAAKHDMPVGVTLGGHDGDATFLVDPQEPVRLGHRLQGVDSDGQATVRTVLEADGRRQARGHFAVGLRLGGTGTDG